MRSHKDILVEHYGCESLEELVAYLPSEISIKMIEEAMEIAANQAFEQSREIAEYAGHSRTEETDSKYEEFEDYLKDLEDER